MVARRQQFEFECERRTSGDSTTGMRDEVSVNRSAVDDRVAPVIQRHALGKELGTQAVGRAIDRIDPQILAHDDLAHVRSGRADRCSSAPASASSSPRAGMGRTASPPAVVTTAVSRMVVEVRGEHREGGGHKPRYAVRVGARAAFANHFAPAENLRE